MAGNQIVLSLNVDATKHNFDEGIQNIVNQINANPPKIKLDIDPSSLSGIQNKINKSLSQLNISLKGTNLKLDDINLNNTSKALSTLKEMAQVKYKIEKLKLVSDSDVKQVDQEAQALNNLFAKLGQKLKDQTGKSFNEIVKEAKLGISGLGQEWEKAWQPFQNKIDLSEATNIDKLITKAQSFKQIFRDETIKEGSAHFAEYSKAFSEYTTSYNNFQNMINSHAHNTPFTKEDVATAEALISATDRLAQIQNQVKFDNKQTSQLQNIEISWQKIIDKVHDYNDKFRAAFSQDPVALAQFDAVMTKIEKHDFASPKEAMMALLSVTNKFQQVGLETESTWGRIKRLFQEKWGYAAMAALVNYSQQALRQVYQNVVDIDSAMTELKKVTDESAVAYQRFLDGSASAATSIGAKMNDYINSVADFSRVGFNMTDSQELAKVANIYKNVADGISGIDEATSVVISTMKAFNLEASESMHIADAYNEVGNNFAISSAGIGEALQRSASAMAAANNTFEETIGLAVAMNDSVQDAQKVGNTLKTVSMYLRAAKAELRDAGEETDGMAESMSKLRDVILQLTSNTTKPVDILADDLTYKSTYQILKEIAEIYDQLNDIDSATLLEKLGGKRNANAVASLLNNFKDAEAAMQTALNSTGSAVKENEKQLESVSGKITKIQSQFQAFSIAALDSGTLKAGLDIANGFLKTVTWIVDKVGLLPPLLTTVTGILSRKDIFSLFKLDFNNLGTGKSILSSGLKSRTKDLIGIDTDELNALLNSLKDGTGTVESFFQHFSKMSKEAQDVGLGFLANAEAISESEGAYTAAQVKIQQYGAAQEAMALKTKLSTIATAALNAAIMAGITVVISLAIQKISEYAHATETAQQSMKDFAGKVKDTNQSIANATKTYTSLKDRYYELAKGVDAFGNNIGLTNDEFDEYNSIVDELSATFPSLVTGYSSTGQAILSCKSSVQELDNAYKNFIQTQKSDLFKELNKNVSEFKKSLNGSDWSGFGATGYQTQTDILQSILSAYNNSGGKVSGRELAKSLNSYGYFDIMDTLADAGVISQKTSNKNKFVGSTKAVLGKYTHVDFDGVVDEINNGMAHVIAAINSNKAIIEEETNSLKESLIIGLNFDDKFSQLDDGAKSLGEFLVNSFTSIDFSSGIFKDQSGDKMVATFINEFKDALSRQDNIDIFNELLSLDRGSMSIGDWRNTVQQKVQQLTDALSTESFKLDESKVMEMFNFDTSLTSVDKFIAELQQKFGHGIPEIMNSVEKYVNGLDVNKFSKVQALMQSSFGEGIVSVNDLNNKISVLDRLGSSLNTIMGGFDSAARAAAAYNDAIKEIKDIDYDMAFNTYSSALETVGNGINSGNYRTKEMQIAVEFLYGSDVLSQLLSGDLSVKELENRYSVSKALFSYKDNSGKTQMVKDADDILDHWNEITGGIEGFQSKLIESKETGNRTLKFVASDLDKVAEHCHTTKDAAAAFFSILQGGAKFEFDLSEVKNQLKEFGMLLNGDTTSTNKIQELMSILSQSWGIEIDDSQIKGLIKDLETAGVNIIDFSADAKVLEDKFKYLADSSGKIDIMDIVRQMQDLGATSGEISQVVDKFSELHDSGVDIKVDGNFELAKETAKMLDEIPEEKRMEFIAEVQGLDATETLHDLLITLHDIAVHIGAIDEASPVLNDVQNEADETEGTVDIDIDVSGDGIEAFQDVKNEKAETEGTVNIDVDVSDDAVPALQDIQAEEIATEGPVQIDITAIDKTSSGVESAKDNVESVPKSTNTILNATDQASHKVINVHKEADGVPKSTNTTLNATDQASHKVINVHKEADSVPKSTNTTLKAIDKATQPIEGVKRITNGLPKEKSIIVRVTAKISDALKKLFGVGGLSGTATFATGTAFASGYWGATSTTRALVGELGPELRVDRHTGRWDLLGENGAEFANVRQGDIIFNAEQTKQLLENGRIGSRGRALLNGTAFFDGTAYANGKSKSSKSSSSSSTSSSAENASKAWKEVLDYHNYLLKMEKESEADYWKWYEANYKKYLGTYKENLQEVRDAEVAVYEYKKKAASDAAAAAVSAWKEELEYHEYLVKMDIESEAAYWEWYETNYKEYLGDYVENLKEVRAAEVAVYEHENKAISDAAAEAVSAWKEELEYHEYLLKMDMESEAEYWAWYEDNYKWYLGDYTENIKEVRDAEIAVYEYRKKAISDAAAAAVAAWKEELAYHDYLLKMEMESEAEYWAWYEANYQKYLGDYTENLDEVRDAEVAIHEHNSNAISDAAAAAVSAWKEELSYHDYLLKMDMESESEYWAWYAANYHSYLGDYVENLEEVRDAEVAIYESRKKAASEAAAGAVEAWKNELDFHDYLLKIDKISEAEYWDWYESNYRSYLGDYAENLSDIRDAQVAVYEHYKQTVSDAAAGAVSAWKEVLDYHDYLLKINKITEAEYWDWYEANYQQYLGTYKENLNDLTDAQVAVYEYRKKAASDAAAAAVSAWKEELSYHEYLMKMDAESETEYWEWYKSNYQSYLGEYQENFGELRDAQVALYEHYKQTVSDAAAGAVEAWQKELDYHEYLLNINKISEDEYWQWYEANYEEYLGRYQENFDELRDAQVAVYQHRKKAEADAAAGAVEAWQEALSYHDYLLKINRETEAEYWAWYEANYRSYLGDYVDNLAEIRDAQVAVYDYKKQAASDAADGAIEAWREELGFHEYLLNIDRITEAEYWDWYEANYKEYLGTYKENLEDLRDAQVAVYDYRKKAAENAANDAINAWREELDYHEYLLKIDKISEKEYWDWYRDNYQNYLGTYRENLDELRDAQVTVYEHQKQAVSDAAAAAVNAWQNELKYHQYLLDINRSTEAEYWAWYEANYRQYLGDYVENLDNIREAQVAVYDYKKKAATDAAAGAVEAWQNELKFHQYLLDIDKMSETEYWTWYEANYQQYLGTYKENLDDLRDAQVAVYEHYKQIASDAAADAVSAWQKELNYHQYLLNLDKISEEEYWNWYKNNYEQYLGAYKENYEELRDAQVAVYGHYKQAVSNAASEAVSAWQDEVKYHQYLLDIDKLSEAEYWDWYESNYKEYLGTYKENLDDLRDAQVAAYNYRKNSASDAAAAAVSAWQEELKYHEYLLNIDQSSEAEYWAWYEANYRQYLGDYVENLDEIRDAQTAVYDYKKKAASDAVAGAVSAWQEELNYHDYLLKMDKISEAEYWKWYENNYRQYLGAYEENLDELHNAEIAVYEHKTKAMSDAAANAVSLWNEELDKRNHLLEMEQISEDEYWKWYAANYKAYLGDYVENINEVWKAEEAVFNKRKEAAEEVRNSYISTFQDTLSYHQYLLDMEKISDKQYWEWLRENIGYVRDLYGEDSSEYRDYEVKLHDHDKQASQDAYNAVNDLVSIRVSMIKQQLNEEIDTWKKKQDEEVQIIQDRYDEETELAKSNNEENLKLMEEAHKKEIEGYKNTRDAKVKAAEDALKKVKASLNEELKAYQKLANSQIEAMRSVADEEDYLTNRDKKRKNISDLEYKAQQYRAAGDAASIRKALEIESQIQEARDELSSFERNRVIEQREKEINNALSRIEEAINKSIDEKEEATQAETDRLKDLYDTQIENAEEAYERSVELAKKAADDTIVELEKQCEKEIELTKQQYDEKISSLEEFLNNQKALRDQAVVDLQDETGKVYEEMIRWNELYGDGITNTIVEKWRSAAKNSADYGGSLKELSNITIPDFTSSAVSGWGSATQNTSAYTTALKDLSNIQIPDFTQEVATKWGLVSEGIGDYGESVKGLSEIQIPDFSDPIDKEWEQAIGSTSAYGQSVAGLSLIEIPDFSESIIGEWNLAVGGTGAYGESIKGLSEIQIPDFSDPIDKEWAQAIDSTGVYGQSVTNLSLIEIPDFSAPIIGEWNQAISSTGAYGESVNGLSEIQIPNFSESIITEWDLASRSTGEYGNSVISLSEIQIPNFSDPIGKEWEQAIYSTDSYGDSVEGLSEIDIPDFSEPIITEWDLATGKSEQYGSSVEALSYISIPDFAGPIVEDWAKVLDSTARYRDAINSLADITIPDLTINVRYNEPELPESITNPEPIYIESSSNSSSYDSYNYGDRRSDSDYSSSYSNYTSSYEEPDYTEDINDYYDNEPEPPLDFIEDYFEQPEPPLDVSVNYEETQPPIDTEVYTPEIKEPEPISSGNFSKGDTVTVKKTATHYSPKSKSVKMASYVPGTSFVVSQVSGDEVLISDDEGYIGWVYKDDLILSSRGSGSKSSSGLSKGDIVTVKKSATHYSSKSNGVKMASYVPGTSFTVSQISGDEVLISDDEGYIGWVKKSDLVGYASGTNNAVGGLALTDERGPEVKLTQNKGRGQYSLLNSGDFVFTHEMSQRLYEFARGNVVPSIVNSITGKYSGISGGNVANNLNIKMGDINISGNTTDQTVSQIRREQRKQVNDLLYEFKHLK